ncbi:CheR family methyltransferase [Ferruginivarius sediminum]|uniref:protein-glutamate O-methyltransferase n=1 Tax=Ferruginivarius sediminum TaxID=2661937 RepID=A0A369TL53_9PROT|nr:protein-glutamate O-methyltransferase CheR [Ferruginivarius sediminum]RDD63626.1 protein-glutamate O-methyltransferase CheR [Ferruginivarius sediminum]
MNPQDFEKLAALLHGRSGLVLGSDKAYLAESRLGPVARQWQYVDVHALIRALARREGSGADARLLDDVVEAMTTNESFFFRDNKPFDQFREFVLPALMSARSTSRSIRIWSAACSSGQEPYSLAMILKEMGARLEGWNIEILGTDISRAILKRARDGIYSQLEVQRGLPIQLLAKYFDQRGDQWQVKEEIRHMVQFREHNLLGEPPAAGRFDVVFCRNVLIYFDQATKAQVLAKVAKAMAGDGYLTLGGAETVLGVSDHFRTIPEQRGLYGRADAPTTVAASGT